MKKIISTILILMLVISGFTVIMGQVTSKTLNSDTISKAKKTELNQLEEPNILRNLDRIGGYFIENRGQINEDSVKYYIQGKGVWFLDDGVVFEIKESKESWSLESGRRESGELPYSTYYKSENENPHPTESVVLKLNFEGCKKVTPIGRELLTHRSNFFYGNDSSKWCTNVHNYQEIIYENIYDNIDLRYYFSENGLKYDFIIHPGGSPNNIWLEYEGAQELYIDSYGDLTIKTPLGNIIDSKLFIYQNVNTKKNKIEGKFIILDTKTYGFEILTEYERNKDLIIDPLVYSTYIGSTGWDVGNSISVDSNGNAYVTGYTEASDFPTTGGAYDTAHHGGEDVFVLKLNPTGSNLIYSTFIGGSSADEGNHIIVDSNGSAYITGFTSSSNFPYTSGAYDNTHNGVSDVFLVKLKHDGSDLLYSTFMGGAALDIGYSITIDSGGNAYVTGAASSGFPTTAGAYDNTHHGCTDVFVAKLNPAGTGLSDLVYSTFVGGSGYDYGYGITNDSSGNAYITGTATTNFPTTPGAYNTNHNSDINDVFVLKLNPTGSSLLYSTFIGGNDDEQGRSIAIDSNNNVYVTGKTQSSNFPTTTSAYDTSFNQVNDIFVVKLNQLGSGLGYSTFVGGSNDDQGRDIKIDSFGYAYIIGYSSSNNFPITADTAYDTSWNGDFDVVVINLDPTGSTLTYSTYVGAMDEDQGEGVAIDSDYNMYVTGATKSSNFPNTPGAFNNSYNGGYKDGFILKLEINHLPIVIDLNVSQSSILRKNTIYIYSNGTDIEDLESELIPTFEYKDAGHISWQNKSFGTPAYINNRWQVSFQLDITSYLGYYDFRVRYRDKGLLDGDWFYFYNGLKVLNNLPEIEDLTLSKAQAIQNENLSATVNGTDIEDLEKNFTVTVQYRDPTWEYWNSTLTSGKSFKLRERKYVGDRWIINFSIPFDAPFGYYDFRANITDCDGNYTRWLYANDSLLISNCKPEILDIELSQYSIYRNESVYLYADCNDYETPENKLGYQAEYKQESDTEWFSLLGLYSENRWQSKFDTNISTKLGFYNFRVIFEDGVNESTGWQHLEEPLEVLNNPPTISYDLDDIEIGMKAVTFNLTSFESDLEDSNEDLIWSVDESRKYEYLESVSIMDPLKDLLTIVPKIDVIGEEDIELTLTDKDGGADVRSNITVHVDSTVTELTPKVTLLSPSHNGLINTLTPTLKWALDCPGDDIITFTIFLDENPDPKTEIISELITTSYTLEEKLENNKTYYWQVLPSWGITLSKPFNFTIDTGFHIDHNVSLSSKRNFASVKQGESVKINLTVKNEGNVADTFKIEYKAVKIRSLINIDEENIQLNKGTSRKVLLSINVPPNFETGDGYIINVKAISMGNISRTDEVNITVDILSRFFIANYNVSLEVTPALIEIQQGKSKNVTLIIENTGNVADEYYIEFRSDTFMVDDVQIMNETIMIDSLFLKPGFVEHLNVIITVPEDMESSLYLITFKVKSYEAVDSAELTVNVLETSDTSKPPEDNKVEDNSMFYAGVGITIIIIIVILILLFLFLRKKKEEEYLSVIKEEVEKEKKAVASKPDVEKAPTPKPTVATAAPEQLPMAQPMKVDTATSELSQEQAAMKAPKVAEPQPSQQPLPQVSEVKPSKKSITV